MRTLLRWLAFLLAVLVLVAAMGAAAAYIVSERRVTEKVSVPTETLVIPTDPATIARGRHLARAMAKCVDCHGDDFAGQVMVENGAMGRWVSLNLTRGKGGVGGQLSDADFVRAIRHGVAPDGRKLMMMPSREYVNLSADDLAAIIAYVKSMPPVDKENPPSKLGMVARVLIATGKLPLYEADFIDHTLGPAAAQTPGPTVQYGRYLASVSGCMGCHGPGLSGGKILTGPPDWPPAANLTPTGIGTRYTEEKFFKALREGVKPEGTAINPAMPFRLTKEMTDDEIRAVWAYLQTVAPKEFGSR